jgi:hypothetical protein
MIIGAHAVITSTRPEADVAFFREVLKLPSTDDGGYVIFGLPPAEVSLHEADQNDKHELFLMCKDIKAFVAAMTKRGIACAAIQDQGWGILSSLTLPGGGKLSVYQPRHKRPGSAKSKPKAKAASKGKKRRK